MFLVEFTHNFSATKSTGIGSQLYWGDKWGIAHNFPKYQKISKLSHFVELKKLQILSIQHCSKVDLFDVDDPEGSFIEEIWDAAKDKSKFNRL